MEYAKITHFPIFTTNAKTSLDQ